jgi:hypothetical protein
MVRICRVTDDAGGIDSCKKNRDFLPEIAELVALMT